MNASQITAALVSETFTNDDINAISNALLFARQRVIKSVKAALSNGDMVKFKNTKLGVIMEGKVINIAQKYVTVQTDHGLWKVPANMLTPA